METLAQSSSHHLPFCFRAHIVVILLWASPLSFSIILVINRLVGRHHQAILQAKASEKAGRTSYCFC